MAETVEDILFAYLRDVIYKPAQAELDLKKLPDNFQNIGKGLLYFVECVKETTTLAKDLSKGELSGNWPSKGNEIASPLKALHATLKHLTWQTQQVAKGDYKQRVSFMGDFSVAFNSMVVQLDEHRQALLDEIKTSRQKTLALAQSNSLFEAVTEQIAQWIVVMDKSNGEWLFSNHDIGDIVASPWCEDQLRVWMERQSDITNEEDKSCSMDLELPKGGEIQYFSVALYPLHWYEHDALAFVFTDISSEKEQLHELETVAYRDTLTKAYNRHYGMKALDEWLEAGKTFIIGFVDMDNLKYVNDKFGHAEGDKYILTVAEILREFSSDAIICRLGGDEFMLLAQNWSAAAAEEHLEKLRDCLLRFNDMPDSLYNHSMSYGVIGVAPGCASPASKLLSVADEKMYAYKRAHKMQRQSSVA
ncbi:MAG: GGDEF domain-containing protein [Synergistaceae bacterium]|jgi:diguanylate cyclase (GGDEF)-like protein|nr:GGDEF domain-containing protein [Synergistaceae bacterium]